METPRAASRWDRLDVLVAVALALAAVLLGSSLSAPSGVLAGAASGLSITKVANDASVDAGQPASFTITVWNAGPGETAAVTLDDELPDGVNWAVELVSPDADDACASSITSDGQSFSCQLGSLPVTEAGGGKVVLVSGQTDAADCGSLDNTAVADAPDDGTDPVSSSASIAVRCPRLTLDMMATAETVVIAGAPGAQAATPSAITWTLAYALTEGPVSGALITDALPPGLTYVAGSAGPGSSYDSASRTLTWSFASLTASGSVSFQTSVDVATISRTAPTENAAIIDSAETAPDDARRTVSVAVEAPPLGGNPTPRPSASSPLPDTAGIDEALEPLPVVSGLLLLVSAVVVGRRRVRVR